MRIVIELKKDSNSELIISNLYKKTTLQTNFGAIFLALIKGKPVQLNLKKYLNYFLEFREETIRKRTFYFLKNTLEKLEISEGLSKATKNIKKVIEIIEESENSVQARSKLIENFFLSEKQANSVLDMPLKKLTTLEKNQIDNDIKILEEKKNYFQKLLNERELLLELLIEELLILKKKYNVIRKTKIIKNINQNEELEPLNNQILEDFINKKTKLYIDNRLYLKRMILGNYKKSFEVVNKIIDNKNIQKFICNIEKNIKLIGITNTGKVFNIDWESSINKDYKLDNKILGNIHPNEIINFHSIKKETRNYLCILNSDGRFKKVLFDEDMIKSNRSFTITKLKNNFKTIDSFISNENKDLMNLTCSPLGRGESEIDLAALETIESKIVKPKSLKASPINMECKLFKIVDLPTLKENEYNGIIIGHVLGLNINDEYIKDGMIDIKKLRPLARLGYMDYSVVDNFFQMNRPN